MNRGLWFAACGPDTRPKETPPASSPTAWSPVMAWPNLVKHAKLTSTSMDEATASGSNVSGQSSPDNATATVSFSVTLPVSHRNLAKCVQLPPNLSQKQGSGSNLRTSDGRGHRPGFLDHGSQATTAAGSNRASSVAHDGSISRYGHTAPQKTSKS